MRANAVELTADAAWYLADTLRAGPLPWVLAITPPYREPAHRAAFEAEQVAHLNRLGVMDPGTGVNPAVAQWVRTICRATRWLELRFVADGAKMLRGVLARDGARAVAALRTADLVTLTEMDIDHPHALVPVVTAGLSGRAAARFDEFSLPAAVGARADEQLRNGVQLREVLQFLGIPASARAVVEAAFSHRRTYVEIVAGRHRARTEVGVSIIDTAAGRILVSPSRAFDGQWVSTFAPGTPLAIAAAVERLTAALPDGSWFPDTTLLRDFDRTEDRCPTTL